MIKGYVVTYSVFVPSLDIETAAVVVSTLAAVVPEKCTVVRVGIDGGVLDETKVEPPK